VISWRFRLFAAFAFSLMLIFHFRLRFSALTIATPFSLAADYVAQLMLVALVFRRSPLRLFADAAIFFA